MSIPILCEHLYSCKKVYEDRLKIAKHQLNTFNQVFKLRCFGGMTNALIPCGFQVPALPQLRDWTYPPQRGQALRDSLPLSGLGVDQVTQITAEKAHQSGHLQRRDIFCWMKEVYI